MELSYIFSKKDFLIFRETELFLKTSYISGGNFPSKKNKRNPLRKIFLYFQKFRTKSFLLDSLFKALLKKRLYRRYLITNFMNF